MADFADERLLAEASRRDDSFGHPSNGHHVTERRLYATFHLCTFYTENTWDIYVVGRSLMAAFLRGASMSMILLQSSCC